MEHRLVNVAQRQVTHLGPDQLEIVGRKAAAFTHEVIGTGMQQEHVSAVGFQLFNDLPDLVRCSGAKIAGPGEANSSDLDPRTVFAREVPRGEERPGGVERRFQQNQQVVLGEVIEPGWSTGREERFIVIAFDGDDGNARLFQQRKDSLRLAQVRRIDLWSVEQIAAEQENIGFLRDCRTRQMLEGIGKIGVRKPEFVDWPARVVDWPAAFFRVVRFAGKMLSAFVGQWE